MVDFTSKLNGEAPELKRLSNQEKGKESIAAHSLARDIKELSNRAIFIKLTSFQNEIFL